MDRAVQRAPEVVRVSKTIVHLRWVRLAGALLLLLALAGTALLLWNKCFVAQLTVDQLSDRLSRDLPIGTEESEIRSYLEQQNVETGTFHASGFSDLSELSPETRVIWALYRDTGPEWSYLFYTDIEAFFILDAEGDLSRIVIERINIGP